MVARVLWAFPLLLFFLSLNQAKVAYDLRTTWVEGARATAEVVELEVSDRVDVTYDYVSLRVPLADGSVLVKERMSLPHSLAPRLEGTDTLDVRVRPGSAQELVVARLMPSHWHIAASQFAISFLGFLMFGGGVFAWNRYLARQESD